MGKGNGVHIIVSMNAINEAYNDVVYWRKNLFLVPYGKIGKDFIDELLKKNGFRSEQKRIPRRITLKV